MDKARYPPDWARISRAIKDAALWRCEACGIAHGTPRPSASHPGKPFCEVITCAHLGIDYPDGRPGNPHDKMDCRPENLAALCTRCHLDYDRVEHVRQRRRNRLAKEAWMYDTFLFEISPENDEKNGEEDRDEYGHE